MDRRTLLGSSLGLLLLSAGGRAYAGSEKKKGGGTSYIQFPTLTATARRPNGRRGVISIEAGIDVADAALYSRADQSQPILRDAYIRWLDVYAAALTPGAPPDPDQIQAQLQRITDAVLHRAGAKLLIGTVMMN